MDRKLVVLTGITLHFLQTSIVQAPRIQMVETLIKLPASFRVTILLITPGIFIQGVQKCLCQTKRILDPSKISWPPSTVSKVFHPMDIDTCDKLIHSYMHCGVQCYKFQLRLPTRLVLFVKYLPKFEETQFNGDSRYFKSIMNLLLLSVTEDHIMHGGTVDITIYLHILCLHVYLHIYEHGRFYSIGNLIYCMNDTQTNINWKHQGLLHITHMIIRTNQVDTVLLWGIIQYVSFWRLFYRWIWWWVEQKNQTRWRKNWSTCCEKILKVWMQSLVDRLNVAG